ncbi:armadillo-type protein [Melampsora americana]|nr:armadillo-type protein [Melampsora americana]
MTFDRSTPKTKTIHIEFTIIKTNHSHCSSLKQFTMPSPPAQSNQTILKRNKNSRSISPDLPQSTRTKLSTHSTSQPNSPIPRMQDEKPKPDPKFETQKAAATRAGGAYIPPAKLRAIQAELATNDPSSPEYQRMRWDALRKSINGLINKVNVPNIKYIVPELFGENLIRGRGLFVRSIMRAQASSLPFTPVFAALVSIINTKLPTLGELLVTRVVSQFRTAYRRNDKVTCVATTIFIAQLVNQQVAHHLLAFEMITLLLEKPTDDSVEIAVGFTKEVGAFLSEAEPKASNSVYELFCLISLEGTISSRVRFMINVLFRVRKDRFKDNPVLPEGLDIVDEDDIITHPIHLDDELQVQEGLNVFKFDPNYLECEEKYIAIKNEILSVDSNSDSDLNSEVEIETSLVQGKLAMHYHTDTNLINFRRHFYLTIMSSLDHEEAGHKMLKAMPEGLELHSANMILECCSQERSYLKTYGILAERFCKVNSNWIVAFEGCFRNYYDKIHTFGTNRLRNIARFFGQLLSQDAIPWSLFEIIKMNENDTTSSSRIFVKIMFQELSESLGLQKLANRFKDDDMKVWCHGLFPIDNPKNTRFSINYLTSIGLGVLTEEMREQLKQASQIIMVERRESEDAESSLDEDSGPHVSSGAPRDKDSSTLSGTSSQSI